jgi:hypothetical protein
VCRATERHVTRDADLRDPHDSSQRVRGVGARWQPRNDKDADVRWPDPHRNNKQIPDADKKNIFEKRNIEPRSTKDHTRNSSHDLETFRRNYGRNSGDDEDPRRRFLPRNDGRIEGNAGDRIDGAARERKTPMRDRQVHTDGGHDQEFSRSRASLDRQKRLARQTLASTEHVENKYQDTNINEVGQTEGHTGWLHSGVAYKASREGGSVPWSRGGTREAGMRNMPRGQTDADWRDARAQAHISKHVISNKHGEREDARLATQAPSVVGTLPLTGISLDAASVGREQEAKASGHTCSEYPLSQPHKAALPQSHGAHVHPRAFQNVVGFMPQETSAKAGKIETRSGGGLHHVARLEKLEIERMSTPSAVESEQTHEVMPNDAQPDAHGDENKDRKGDELPTATAQARHWPNR